MGRRFEALDGLRGVAALAVVLHHLPSPKINALLPGAYLAVDLFFALSGFVLAEAYLAKVSTTIPPWRFLLMRAARFYPLYGVALALSAAMLLYSIVAGGMHGVFLPRALLTLAVNLAFLPSPYVPGAMFPTNIPAWSLFWELSVNLLFAALAWRGWLARATIPIMTLGAAALATAALSTGSLEVGGNTQEFLWGAARVTFSFFAGLLAHRIWAARGSGLHLPAWGAAIVLGVVFVAPVPPAVRPWFDLAAAALFPFLVIASADAPAGGLARQLGAASFGIYVLHVPLIHIAETLGQHLGYSFAAAGLVGAGCALAVVTLVALALDTIWDRPARSALALLTAPHSQVTGPAK